MKTNKCLECGKEFHSKNDRKFCCKECYLKHISQHGTSLLHTREKNLVEVKCAVCGKVEYIQQSRAKKYKTCSRQCMGKYASVKYSQKITLTCPICGVEYVCKASGVAHHKTCGSKQCRHEWLTRIHSGAGNNNYRSFGLASVTTNEHDASRHEYKHVVKHFLGLDSVKCIPSGYVIHHKDCNHSNNNPHNLVVIPKSVHRQLHTRFGNILMRGLEEGKLDRALFFSMCTKEEAELYSNIIDLDVTRQAVVKQGELLGSPEEDNQQPSIYRNIFEGSTTNERVLPGEAEDGNLDTSALPSSDTGDEIV